MRFLLLCLLPILIDSSSLRSKRGLSGTRWPTNKIAYSFSESFDENTRLKIELVLKEVERLTISKSRSCVLFVPRTDEKDFIKFVDKGQCSSGVGYDENGDNEISLAIDGCITPGTIMHELVHRLGFDHEHSRFDRDKFIEVRTEYLKGSKINFEINKNNADNVYDSPYDYKSITHYNSDVQQIDKSKEIIISKFPALLSKDNRINFERSTLSKIDILQIQKFYQCEELEGPNIRKAIEFSDMLRMQKETERFMNEALFNGINEELAHNYIDKSINKCGLDHYWNLEYPLVDSKHKHYEFICEKKKVVGSGCRYSLECDGVDASCIRLFYMKGGFCFKTGNEKLNDIGQKVNDLLIRKGNVVKEEAVKNKEKLIAVVDSTGDLLKTSFSSIKRIFG